VASAARVHARTDLNYIAPRRGYVHPLSRCNVEALGPTTRKPFLATRRYAGPCQGNCVHALLCPPIRSRRQEMGHRTFLVDSAQLTATIGRGLGDAPLNRSMGVATNSFERHHLDTGFPATRRQGSSARPNTAGRPGRIATPVKLNSAPRSLTPAHQIVFFPIDTPPARTKIPHAKSAFRCHF